MEKALKALLVLSQIEFPLTHAIGPLLYLCKTAGYYGTEDLLEAVSLTQYAVTSRYPGEEDPVNREEAKQASEIASNVLNWVEGHISNQEP